MELDQLAFLDIETSWERLITVIGVYRPLRGTVQWIAPNISASKVLEGLEGVRRLYTFNGACFDIPVLRDQLGIDLSVMMPHQDLLRDCRKKKLKGGLKSIEAQLGIHRETAGTDGLEAMNLWAAHQRGSAEALERLLLYNREDIENLEILARKLELLPKDLVAAKKL